MKFPIYRAARNLALRFGPALAALALTAGCSASILLDAARPALLPGRTDLIHGPLSVPPDIVHKTPGRG